MKKIIAVLALTLMTGIAFSDIIDLKASLEIGWLPNGTALMIEDSGIKAHQENEDEQFYTDLSADVWLFDHVFVGGSVKTYMFASSEEINFDPNQDMYTFHVGATYKGIEIGFEHMCTHPVVTYSALNWNDKNWEGYWEYAWLSVKEEIVEDLIVELEGRVFTESSFTEYKINERNVFTHNELIVRSEYSPVSFLFVGGELTVYSFSDMLAMANAGIRIDDLEVGIRAYTDHPMSYYIPEIETSEYAEVYVKISTN